MPIQKGTHFPPLQTSHKLHKCLAVSASQIGIVCHGNVILLIFTCSFLVIGPPAVIRLRYIGGENSLTPLALQGVIYYI